MSADNYKKLSYIFLTKKTAIQEKYDFDFLIFLREILSFYFYKWESINYYDFLLFSSEGIVGIMYGLIQTVESGVALEALTISLRVSLML
jgi:hypothetical protein